MDNTKRHKKRRIRMFNIKYAAYSALMAIILWLIPSFLQVGFLGIIFCKGLAIIIGGLLMISTIAGVLSDIRDKFSK